MPTTSDGQHSFAFFVRDEGGWWSFKGIHVDREEGIRLVEIHKHGPHCAGIVAMELPTGKKIYEWSREGD
jgi:hypothetical protein